MAGKVLMGMLSVELKIQVEKVVPGSKHSVRGMTPGWQISVEATTAIEAGLQTL